MTFNWQNGDAQMSRVFSLLFIKYSMRIMDLQM